MVIRFHDIVKMEKKNGEDAEHSNMEDRKKDASGRKWTLVDEKGTPVESDEP